MEFFKVWKTKHLIFDEVYDGYFLKILERMYKF